MTPILAEDSVERLFGTAGFLVAVFFADFRKSGFRPIRARQTVLFTHHSWPRQAFHLSATLEDVYVKHEHASCLIKEQKRSVNRPVRFRILFDRSELIKRQVIPINTRKRRTLKSFCLLEGILSLDVTLKDT